MGWYEEYSLDVGLSKLWDDPGNNRTRIRLYVNVYAGGAYYMYYGTDAYIHIDLGAGQAIVEDNGTNHGTGWTPWAIARPTQTSLNGNYQTTTVWYGDYWLYHDSNGYASYTVYGSFESWGTWGTPTLTDPGGWTTAGLSDYNRSAKVPYFDDITRAGDGNISHFYTHFARTGNYDSGETSYTLQRATNQAMTADLANIAEGHLYDYDQYKAYFFRMYATGNEGGAIRSNGGNGDGTWGPYYGRPYAPGWTGAVRSTNTSGKIDLSWNTPSNSGNSGYGSIQQYHIYRNGTRIATSQTITGNSFSDTGLERGSTHSYEIYALGSSYWSPVSQSTYTYLGNANIMAPGVPSGPSTVNTPTRVGRNVTVTAPKDANGYGNAVTEYRIQYATSDDNYATWYGWNGTTGILNAYNSMNISGSEATFFYSMLTAAKTYKFRIYAVNSIGAGSQTTDSTVLALPWFLPASGKKWDGTSWSSTQVAKRWNPVTAWTDISTAKRYTTVGAPTSGSGTTNNVLGTKGYYTRLNYSWSYNSGTELVTISGEYILGAGSTYFANSQLTGSLTVNGQTVWSPVGNYSINANSEITLATFNLTVPKANISYNSIPIASSIQMSQQGYAWSLPLITSSLSPQVIGGTWVELS